MLLFAAIQATAASAVGIALGIASHHWKILSPSSAKDLSRLQATILEPLQAFSALSLLNASDLIAGIPLLLWAPLHCILALCLALPLLPRSPRRGALLLCATFGNAGALPKALIPALLTKVAATQGMLFIDIYLVTWRLLLWGLGPALLSSSTMKKSDDATSTAPSKSLLEMLLPPPSVGSLAGLALAFAPSSIQQAVLRGPLSFVVSASQQAGAASAPIALITLGFALGGTTLTGTAPEGERHLFFSFSERLWVCVSRLLLLPLVHVVLYYLLHPAAAGLASEPLHLVLLLQAAMPSAVSVQAIFQLQGADTRPLGQLMVMQYLMAMPTIVLTVVLASTIA